VRKGNRRWKQNREKEVKIAAGRLYRGSESKTVVKDLYRTVRPFSVKHGPGKSLLNDPVTVFFVCTEVEVSARPVCDKEDRPAHESDPVDQGIGMTRGKDFPTHCRGLVINLPPWFRCPVFHGVTPLLNVQP
jgi:hypothetical protein